MIVFVEIKDGRGHRSAAFFDTSTNLFVETLDGTHNFNSLSEINEADAVYSPGTHRLRSMLPDFFFSSARDARKGRE